VGKTQAELKKACEDVMGPGEAGLMATHVELQSMNRANFIGAAPTLAYVVVVVDFNQLLTL
jgi:hypothetical protein